MSGLDTNFGDPTSGSHVLTESCLPSPWALPETTDFLLVKSTHDPAGVHSSLGSLGTKNWQDQGVERERLALGIEKGRYAFRPAYFTMLAL